MMTTEHNVINGDSRNMKEIANDSINLVVTSPPYPMITMWDELFCSLNPEIKDFLESDGMAAFRLMHEELDKTWSELSRVVKPGGFVCINIGDATRKISDTFKIYPNHSRITMKMIELGFDPLPEIIWHKPTNAPNKFMGSGMLPCGAYVTLEHEYILIFRKGNKRDFKKEDMIIRKKSAYFYEERNEWFSDTWNIVGSKQNINCKARNRSGAFPYEIPKRLILMYSNLYDTVLDPFFGTGTTTIAGMINGRNTIGIEIEKELIDEFKKSLKENIKPHLKDNYTRIKNKNNEKYINNNYNIKVKTKQEKEIELLEISDIIYDNDDIVIEYENIKPFKN